MLPNVKPRQLCKRLLRYVIAPQYLVSVHSAWQVPFDQGLPYSLSDLIWLQSKQSNHNHIVICSVGSVCFHGVLSLTTAAVAWAGSCALSSRPPAPPWQVPTCLLIKDYRIPCKTSGTQQLFYTCIYMFYNFCCLNKVSGAILQRANTVKSIEMTQRSRHWLFLRTAPLGPLWSTSYATGCDRHRWCQKQHAAN